MSPGQTSLRIAILRYSSIPLKMLMCLPGEKEAYMSGHFLLHRAIYGEKITYNTKNTGKTFS